MYLVSLSCSLWLSESSSSAAVWSMHLEPHVSQGNFSLPDW
uniref:Uncharacterized protein n=1 Tax=Anguilla anguilla TaxID=7936 RepID=A0A0E9Q8B1_ANGAN